MQAGDVVLVIAGGSGVGQAAIQIARLHGARVFATAAPGKMEQARAIGAEDVFDHYEGDYSKRLRAATGHRGAESSSSTSAKRRGIAACAPSRGRAVSSHAARPPDHAAESISRTFLRGSSRSSALTWAASRSWLKPHNTFSTATLTPVVDEVLPLADARRAHERLESGRQFGKIVLTP